jgi:uncharacterized protein (DUF427 family)
MSNNPSWLQSARDAWEWRGTSRPDFAEFPGPGQVSVWDFPRPPRLVQDQREVIVRWGDMEVARTTRAVMALETAHPPTFYLPWDDVNQSVFQQAGGGSFCEWKGPAQYWSLVNGTNALPKIAWSYPSPLPGAEIIQDCVAMYATGLHCTVGGELVTPQPGGFYGGWITPELVGPFKGIPGSSGW